MDRDPSHDDQSPGKVAHKSYISRHWRGELSLGRSFWTNGFLINLFFLVLMLFFNQIALSPDSFSRNIKAVFISHLALLSLAITVNVWQVVGIWRSAGNYLKEGNSIFCGNLARIAVVIGILGLISDIRDLRQYPLTEFYKIAFGQDSLGAYELRVLRNQTELEISGPITFGLTDEVEKTLQAHPSIHIIHLNSEGGRVMEARKLRDLIESRELITFTSSSCASACTLAYAAGKERLIGKGASLGFHQSSIPGMTQYTPYADNITDHRDWKKRGFNKKFIEKAFSTPSDSLWRPTHRELFEYGFVTGYPKNDDVAITSLSTKQVDNINELLLENPLFSALKTQVPETYALIAEELQSGLREGKSVTELRKKIFPIIQPVYAERIPYASDAALRSLISLSLDQMGTLEAINPTLCYEYIYGQDEQKRLEIIQLFPENMQQRELAVMTEIILSSTPEKPPTYNQKEVEKQLQHVFSSVKKRYGKDAEVLLNAESETIDKAKMCRATHALYTSILELPKEKSGSLLRFMFSKAQ